MTTAGSAPASGSASPRARPRGPGPSSCTATNSSSFMISAGTSSRSALLRSGMITRLMPARCAASTFSLRPPIGQHAAAQRDLAGHRDVVADADAGEQRDERGEHRDAGARAVLRHAARGDVDVEVALLEEVLRDAEAARRSCGRSESAACADSFMTSPSCPVSWSLPVPYMRVASMKRISPPTLVHARPVATPGLFGALGDFARVAWRAEELADARPRRRSCAA